MIIYISGPITGDKNYKQHFAAAEKEILEGVDSSALVINPAELQLDGFPSWSDYMRLDIENLVRCHAIFMLRGWWRSRGARLERRIAKALKLKIIYER